MKKICVVSNVIGNRDVIKDSKNGYIANNLDEFVEKVKNIGEGSEIIQNKAKTDINESYNTNIMIEKYKKLYIGENEV